MTVRGPSEPHRPDGGAPDVSIAIVNASSRDVLLACLESLAAANVGGKAADVRQQDRAPAARRGVDAEVVVLDNASDDGSAVAVRARFPDVRVIEQRRRAGF